MSYDYDLFVIGAGSGGVRASRIAASYGAKVAVAEEYRVGGTCVIRGCVPKKLMVYAARYGDAIEEARGYGWRIEGATHDWTALIEAKDREIARLEGLYLKGLDGAGAEVIRDRAVLAGPHDIRLVRQERTVTAKNVLIATGAWPWMPRDVEGIQHAITSNEIFELTSRPDRVILVGAGYIALEFASMFRGLGSEVIVVHHRDSILRGFDEEAASHLRHELEKKGIRFVFNAKVRSIEKRAPGDLRATLDTGERIEAGEVVFALGRHPNTAGLGLDKAGVAVSDKDAVIVDSYSRSSVSHIWAVGDVTHRIALTPVAIREGHAVADTIFGGKPTAVDHADIPTAVFTTPEVGTVGLSEEAARQAFGDVHIYSAKFRPMRQTLAGGDEQTLMKLVVDGHGGRVLGCHVVGPDAAEIVQGVAIAVKLRAKKADFDATIALHPSAAEELVLLRTRTR